MIYLGIDFGTSNSSMAFFDGERKMLEVVSPALPDMNKLPGGRVYPSVVAFNREGNMIAAGWFAEGYRHTFPNLAVDLIKTLDWQII
jgi:molecular chaperone DnaK (HSP70)